MDAFSVVRRLVFALLAGAAALLLLLAAAALLWIGSIISTPLH